MADEGFDTYSTTIEAQQKLVDEKPDLVQRFVDCHRHRLVQLPLR